MAGHPCVFIGLGGAGSTTVAHVKRVLLKAIGPDDLKKFCRFLMFDTNEAEYITSVRLQL